MTFPTINDLAMTSAALMIVVGISSIILIFSCLSFWLWMLVDCLKRPENKFTNQRGNDKVYWSLLIFTTFLVGAISYFIIVKTKDRKKGG